MITEDLNHTSNPGWVHYDIQNFDITKSNRTILCPIGPCDYSLVTENREGLRLDDSNGKMLSGLLNIISEGESKTVHLYGYFRGFDSNQEKDKAGQEAFSGTVQFYRGDNALVKEHQINSSLTWKSQKDDDLMLRGQL